MDDIETYLQHAAALQGVPMDAERLARVATIFRRNTELARLVMTLPVDECNEPAPVFRPDAGSA